jgi:hypothetical protein
MVALMVSNLQSKEACYFKAALSFLLSSAAFVYSSAIAKAKLYFAVIEAASFYL